MLTEKSLFSLESFSLLNKKGYKESTNKEGTIYLKNILLKKQADTDVSEGDLKEYKSSLHAFIEYFVVRTNYESDYVPYKLFERHYLKFCNTYHVEALQFNIKLLSEDFQIDAVAKTETFIERDISEDKSSSKSIYSQKKIYIIDVQGVNKFIQSAGRGDISVEGSEIFDL